MSTTIAISKECHKAIKQYLLDIYGYDIGDFIEDAVMYALENVEDFEAYAEIEGESEEELSEKDE